MSTQHRNSCEHDCPAAEEQEQPEEEVAAITVGRIRQSGLKAFRRAYPQGESFVVASRVDSPFERTLLPGLRVHYVGLHDLMRSLTA